LSVQFFYCKTRYKLQQSDRHKKWIIYCVKKLGFSIRQINIVFISATNLKLLNKQFLKRNYDTDIITFDNSHCRILDIELYISPATVKYNAKQFKSTFSNEMQRVIIHGILHCCGYNDNSVKNIKRMRNAETYFINRFK